MNLKQKILLGVTGTVSSVLTKKIVESFIEKGYDCAITLSEAAKSFTNAYDLVGCKHSGVFYDNDEWPVDFETNERIMWQKGDFIPHIDLREEYSAFVLICSASSLAKIANGLCDNLITSLARAWSPYKPFIIAPAMNTTMWEHPLTKKHLNTFKSFSIRNFVVMPQEKMLACGVYGMGALANIEDIVKETEKRLQWKFPLVTCHGVPVYPHPGAFGYVRKNSKHTGLDLYTNLNEEVYAVEDGVVIGTEDFTGPSDNSPWWNDTKCLLVKGPTGVVNYGEINPYQEFSQNIGRRVYKGDAIGRVMRVIKEGREHFEIPGWSPSMLHIEVYNHDVLKASHGFEENVLNDPTPFILKSAGVDRIKTVIYDNYRP